MGGVAKLTSSPRRRNGVLTVRCELASSGYPALARIHDRPGEHFPYAKGDRVTYREVSGDPGAGIVITGIYGSDGSASDGANRVVSGRSKDLEMKAPNGTTRVTAKETVRLGTGEDEDQKQVAIAEETARDTFSIQAQLDQFLAWFVNTYDPSALVPLTAEMQKVIPGWSPLPYLGDPQSRAPDAKPAVDVVAKPED